MNTTVLVSGPPMGPAIWDDVVVRLEHHGKKTHVVDLFHPVPAEANVASLASRLGERIDAIEGPVVLVAHGTAVPIAWRVACEQTLEGLILTNGPMTRLDPFLRLFCNFARGPRLLASTLLRPNLLRSWLASSAGLRRTVVNPYVMDHDMVVAVSETYLSSTEARIAVARFLEDLPKAVENPAPIRTPTLLLWGDEDRLYPPETIDSVRHLLDTMEHRRIAGAQHNHPAERPWEIADAIVEWKPERSPNAGLSNSTTT